jgi:perosamine synthetase
LFQRYQAAFAPVEGVKLMAEPDQCQSNYWLQTLLLDAEQANQRDPILKVTNDAGFMTRPAWTLIHELKPFKDCPRMDLTEAQSLSRRLINIPSSTGL